MQFEKNENKKQSLIKSVIEESKKISLERGEDFYSEKKSASIDAEFSTSKIHNGKPKKTEGDFKTLRKTHLKKLLMILDPI